MTRVDLSNRHYQQQTHMIGNSQCSKIPSTLSSSSNNNTSSVSTDILSICPVSINTKQCLLMNDMQSITQKKQTNHSKAYTSLCIKCNKNRSINEFNLCDKCYRKKIEINSNMKVKDLKSPNDETTPNKTKKGKHWKKLVTLLQKKPKSNINDYVVTNLLDANTQRLLLPNLLPSSSDISKNPSSHQQIHSIESNPIKPSKTNSQPTTITYFSPEHIEFYKYRQIELNRSVEKLIEKLQIKTKENIYQIIKYWSYIKQSCLEQFRSKATCYQLFDYILKPTNINTQFKKYLEENDDLKAILQILLTTLTIVHDRYSFSIINELLSNEENLMIEHLNDELESLLSSYKEQLSITRECIHYYQTHPNKENNSKWIDIIKNDYPLLIEKISTDYINKIPQIEQILIQMLRNMKKTVLMANKDVLCKR